MSNVKLKHTLGAIFMILYSCVIGFILYRFIPDATVWAEQRIQDAGPLIIVVIIVLCIIAWLASYPLKLMAQSLLSYKSTLLAVVCGLLVGAAVTIAIIEKASQGLYFSGFTALFEILAGGIAPIVLSALAIGKPDVIHGG